MIFTLVLADGRERAPLGRSEDTHAIATLRASLNTLGLVRDSRSCGLGMAPGGHTGVAAAAAVLVSLRNVLRAAHGGLCLFPTQAPNRLVVGQRVVVGLVAKPRTHCRREYDVLGRRPPESQEYD